MDSLPYPATRRQTIHPSRKILCVLAFSAAGLVVPSTAAIAASALRFPPAGSSPEAASKRPPLLVRAGLSQAGRDLIFSVRTASPVPLRALEARPDTRRAASRYLCLELRRQGAAAERRLCLGGKARHRIGVEAVIASGEPIEKGSAPARVTRPNPLELVVAVVPGAAGLAPSRYRWLATASPGCGPGARCAEALPAGGSAVFRLRPVRAVGCTGGTAGLVTNGSRARRALALSFDDGPSEYTPSFLRVLREKDVSGTFFEIGDQMPGRESTMRQILAEGDEIGDHTMSHVEFPGYFQIAGAAARIASYTHFSPCLFRPPGGAVDSSVIATAGRLGMRTVTWDVDPRDWSLPGTDAIYRAIVDSARPGSIILMHDGGGPRGETLTALPRVIETLRARGYRFETVSQLLGQRLIYRPYG